MAVPENSITEEWRPVVGFEGRYYASSFGRVYGSYRSRILRPKIDKDGYPVLGLACPPNKTKYVQVHTLVCTAFSGPKPTPKHQVNHLDGVKIHNFPTNLEWSTVRENCIHARDNGLRFRIEDRPEFKHAKLTPADVEAIRAAFREKLTFIQVKELAKKYGVRWNHIYRVRSGERWAHITDCSQSQTLRAAENMD